MDFVPAKKYGENKSKTVTKVTKEDSGFIYITNKLNKKQEKDKKAPMTEIRMIPYVDAEGDLYPALNPEGDPNDIGMSLGLPFSNVEIVSFYKGGWYHLCSSVKDEDKEGNPVPPRTPWDTFMNRISFKHKEIQKQLEIGGAVEPGVQHWNNFFNSTFSRPNYMYVIQVLASKINGRQKEVDGKAVPEGPGVFAIPKGIENKSDFFQKMLTVSEDAPEGSMLSPETCTLGDFYTPDNGRPLRLTRIDKEGNTVYSLNIGGKAWPITVEEARELVRDWDEVLRINYIEDSLEEIAKIWEPRMLAYAFRTSPYKEYLPGLGIDMSIADDILEAKVEYLRGTEVRDKSEIEDSGSKKKPSSQKSEKSTEKEAPKKNTDKEPSEDGVKFFNEEGQEDGENKESEEEPEDGIQTGAEDKEKYNKEKENLDLSLGEIDV